MKISRPANAWTKRALVCAVVACFSAVAQAPEDIRVALVIGNGAYPGSAALANPVNDAAAMSATLRTLGFAVQELKDGSRAQMDEAIAKVREGLRGKQAIAMLYYAGHGVQIDLRNYMIPVDAKLGGVADVPRQTVDVGQVIEAFRSAGTRMNILVLDACRDNPFGTSSGKGLAPIDAPTGTLLAYATAPGNVADDGALGDGNGLYTGFLVKELQKPAARIEDVFKRVRLQVRQHSQGRQIPWESTSLEEDFYFNDGVKFTFKAEDLQKLADSARQRDEQLQRVAREAQERERQQAAQQALAALRAAEAQRLKELADAAAQAAEAQRLKRLGAAQAAEESFRIEKAEWDRVKDSRNVDDFYAFMKKYPSGNLSEHAQARIGILQQAQIQAQGDAGGKPQRQFFRRYEEGDRFEFVQKDGLTGVQNGRGVIEVRYRSEDEFEGVPISGNLPGAKGTRAGFVSQDGGGTYDPPWAVVPGGEYQVGKRHAGRSIRTDFQGRRQWVDHETRVVAREKLQTAFGLVDTYRIEVSRVFEDGAREKQTFWFEPDWGYSVKLVFERRTGGAPLIRIREMVARARKS